MLSQRTDFRPAVSESYEVAGRVLCLRAPDEATAAAVLQHFRDWFLTPVSSSEPDATISVRPFGEPPPAVPRGLESFAVNGGRCSTDGDRYHLELEGSLVRFGGQTRLVEVWPGRDARRGSPSLSQTFFNAFSAAARRAGLFELHSAGVVEPSTSRGALLAGASGSGKSTLTLQLARAGWGYLSDDVLLLSEDAGRAEARPLRRVFAATETTVEAAGLGLGELLRPVNSKLRFAPQSFFPEGFVGSTFPDLIFFPLVTHEPESRLDELPPAGALARLLKLCPWACYDRPTSAPYLRVLSLLARECRAFELRAGRDLLADPARAAGLLAAR